MLLISDLQENNFEKKVIKKRVIRIFYTVIIFFVLYAYACIVFCPKEYDDYLFGNLYRSSSFKGEKKNTIDGVVCGDSDAWSGVTTMQMYEDCGTTFLNMGISIQRIPNLYRQLVEVYKFQNLKFVFLEASCFYTKKFFYNSIRYEKIEPYIAPFAFHSRWKHLKLKDFYTAPNYKRSRFLKGYYFSTTNAHCSFEDKYITPSDTLKDFDSDTKKYFKKIVELCKRKGSELILFKTPCPNSWKKEKYNKIQKTAMENDISYVDLNLESNNCGFDFDNDFRDGGEHLNYYGAKKVTQFLIEYLKKYLETNYSEKIESHKGDSKYSKWDLELEKYKNYLREKGCN